MAADVLLSIEAGYLKLRFSNKKLPSVLSFFLAAPPQTNKQTQSFNKKQKELQNTTERPKKEINPKNAAATVATEKQTNKQTK
jgi:hypothetical protein